MFTMLFLPEFAVPSSYWLITRLCTTWKLLSGIIAKMSRHMAQHMGGAHKGIGRNTSGAKHQLLISKTVTQDYKIRHTNLCTSWINYKKANDSMSRTLILECLELYNINRTLGGFIKNLMAL